MNTNQVVVKFLLFLLWAAAFAESRNVEQRFWPFGTGEHRTVPNGPLRKPFDGAGRAGRPRSGCCLPKVFGMKQYSSNDGLTTWIYVDANNTRQAFHTIDSEHNEMWQILLYHPDTATVDGYGIVVKTKRCTRDKQTGVHYTNICLPETARRNATFTIGAAPATIKVDLWMLADGAGELLATADRCIPVTFNGAESDRAYFSEYKDSVDPKVFVPPKYCPK